MSDRHVIAGSLIWKLLERGGVQVTQFIVSIIIARMLLPSAYGAVAILMIFISIATVFVQSGLNTALIQKKDADETDSSSVLIYSFVIAGIIYLILFFSANTIAGFFNIPQLTSLLRVLALTLFPGAINAVQLAILSKRMQFKKQFYASIIACVISGGIGIAMAYNGYEAWALVCQQLVSQIIICIVLSFLLDWRPKLVISFRRTQSLLSFGVKLLGARLIDTLYHNLESLIIGKVFSASTLAFCNKGKQFPLTLIDNIDGSIQSVMLSAYSAKQDDRKTVKNMLRKTISMSTYIVFPAMIILAAVAKPMIVLLLGEQWIDATPYLQLFCAISMLFPLQTADLQAINALGRSDIYFKLIAWKRCIGVILLISSVIIWRSPFSVVIAALLVEIIAVLINVPANRKVLNYSFKEMMSDILPNLCLSVMIGCICWSITLLISSNWLLLFAQCAIGSILYILVSILAKNRNISYLIDFLPNSKVKNIIRI